MTRKQTSWQVQSVIGRVEPDRPEPLCSATDLEGRPCWRTDNHIHELPHGDAITLPMVDESDAGPDGSTP